MRAKSYFRSRLVANRWFCIGFAACVWAGFRCVFLGRFGAKFGCGYTFRLGAVGEGEIGAVGVRKTGAKFLARAREFSVKLGNICMSRKNTPTPLIRSKKNKNYKTY